MQKKRWIWWALGIAALLFVLLYPTMHRVREKTRELGIREVPMQVASPMEFGRRLYRHDVAPPSIPTPTAGVSMPPAQVKSPAQITLASVRKVAPDRHIIKTASVTIESDDAGSTVRKAIALAKEKGGYVFGLTEEVEPTGEHSAILEIRVPADEFEEVLLAIERLGKIRSKTVRAEDVTEEFLDIQSRLTALRESEKRILKMLSEAEDLDTVMRLENELAARRSEIERFEGRLRYLKERTTFCSISLTITEFRVVATPPETWAAVKVAADAWRELVKVLRALAAVGIWAAIWSILWLPTLLVILVGTRFAIARLIRLRPTQTSEST